MKHRLTITLLLLSMFLFTQFFGLFVVSSYFPTTSEIINPSTGEIQFIQDEHPLPLGINSTNENSSDAFWQIIFSFIIAFALIFFLIKYKWKSVIKTWFFIVVTIALIVSLNAILRYFIISTSIISLIIAVPIAVWKIFKPNVFVHNITELFIYPGIAAVFVPILSPVSIIILLVLISIYDMWAVWKSGIMQKLAKFQMEELNLFGGFLIPSVSKEDREKIKNIRQKYKGKKIPSKIKNKKIKINLAMLGGGDIIFPIITAGVFMQFFGIIPALFVTLGATAGLVYLFLKTEKGKSYPAMPYITIGIFIGILLAKFIGVF